VSWSRFLGKDTRITQTKTHTKEKEKEREKEDVENHSVPDDGAGSTLSAQKETVSRYQIYHESHRHVPSSIGRPTLSRACPCSLEPPLCRAACSSHALAGKQTTGIYSDIM